MRQPFVIGDLVVEAGTKGRGFLGATTRPSGEPLGFPVMVAHGAQDGRTFSLVSGIHGDEYEGGEAARRLWRELDPTTLRGTFIAVPTANVAAFEKGWRISSTDYQNLARVFPGSEAGGPTERVAHALLTEVALRSDCVIDSHGGGVDLSHAAVANFRLGDDEAMNARVVDLARATGLEWLCQAKVGSGQLPDEGIRRGVPVVNIEVGDEGRCREKWVEVQFKVMTNVLKYMGMIDGEPEIPATQVILRDRSMLRVRTSGLWRHRSDLAPRSWVKAGETIGTVSDLFGDVLETVTAPHDGVLNMLRSFPPIQCGDWVAFLWRSMEPAARS